VAQEAQAFGVIPLCPPSFALGHVVRNGILIQGDAEDPLTHRRYADAIEWLLLHRTEADQIRNAARVHARAEYDIEKTVDLHERLADCLSPMLIRTLLGETSTIEQWREWS